MTGLRWLQNHDSPASGDTGGGGTTPERETGELITDRASAFEYYIGRYSLSLGTYTITRIRFSAGKVIKDQATGDWEDRATLTYTG